MWPPWCPSWAQPAPVQAVHRAPAPTPTPDRSQALLERGSRVVGALGGLRLVWGGVVVVHHAGDAVAHSALVAPAGRDRSGVRLRRRQSPGACSPRHHPSVPGGPSTATTPTVGASRDPGQPRPWCSTEQNPRRAVKTQAPDSGHACRSQSTEHGPFCADETGQETHRPLCPPQTHWKEHTWHRHTWTKGMWRREPQTRDHSVLQDEKQKGQCK